MWPPIANITSAESVAINFMTTLHAMETFPVFIFFDPFITLPSSV